MDSEEYNRAISWYIQIFGNPKDEKLKPDIKDVILIHKLETMREATILDEQAYKDMVKHR